MIEMFVHALPPLLWREVTEYRVWKFADTIRTSIIKLFNPGKKFFLFLHEIFFISDLQYGCGWKVLLPGRIIIKLLFKKASEQLHEEVPFQFFIT